MVRRAAHLPRVLLLAATTVAITAGAAGCAAPSGDDAPDSPPDADTSGFDRQAMLRHLVAEVFRPAHEAFVDGASALRDGTAAYCAALGRGDATTERATALAAWRDAVDRWERAEAVLVGPAALAMSTLRNRIYAWPLSSPCGVDRAVPAAFASPATYDVAAQLDNVRSLAAIELLLFATSSEHHCAAPPDGWDALGADLPRARCTLAALIADDVVAAATAVADGWDAYTTALVEAGSSASSIPSLREAVNIVSDALFYVDKMVKDMKVGEAAGISINACGAVGTPCLREVEHASADHATAAIRINLRMFRDSFTGTTATADGPSFEDHLRALGATDLADRMLASTDAAIARADALDDSYLTALTEHRDDVVALHVALRALTDDLKSQFLSVLGLEIPDDVAGDND